MARRAEYLLIKIFKLANIILGMASASFLASGCLQKIIEIEYRNYLAVGELIMKDFYIDDFLSGASTKEELIGINHIFGQILRSL